MPTIYPSSRRADGAPVVPSIYPNSRAPAPAPSGPVTRVLVAVASQAVPTTGVHLRFYLPAGDWAQLRLRGQCGKDVDTITTLTADIYDRPAAAAGTPVEVSTTDIDIEGEGPDDFIAVDSILPLPAVGTYGRMYDLRLSTDASAGDVFGLVLIAEEADA